MDLRKLKVAPLPEAVKEWCEQNSHSRSTLFCQYLEYINGEIVARHFATRLKKKKVRITEVMRSATGACKPVVKNLMYSYGSSYIGVYECENTYYRCGGYPFLAFSKDDFDVWHVEERPWNFSYVCINKDIITSIPEFKYCGYTGGDVIKYLNEFRKDKNIEFFGKMGIPLSPILLKKAKTDGKFRRFLWDNHNGITKYGVEATLYAYKQGVSIGEARQTLILKHRRDSLVAYRLPAVKGTKIDRARLLAYVDSNNIDYALYNDYLKAIKALKYDLKDTKNIYPKDFTTMHDLRIAEHASYEAKRDKKKRAKLYEDFQKTSDKFIALAMQGNKYQILIPCDISELVIEGDVLGHCVGKNGYDKKMADGLSLIAFCREINSPSTPFATIEYDLKRSEIRQFYACGNTKPPEDAQSFVSTWAERIKPLIKEINNEKSNNQIQER